MQNIKNITSLYNLQPQIEVKEFVPKMLETSTGIVKSSANIMKESTFSLIRNISNTNFWKSRLNFKNDLETSAQHESEVKQNEEDFNLQSFPCYYESLHELCRISNNETRYNKYSVTDIENTKLKCCRALLRITILSESSCYGLEISDINHCKYHALLKLFNKFNHKRITKLLLILVLLECAKHTMPDDWLLGIAYLLSLNKNHVLDAQAIFMDLPQIELYIQTALYYYSLELYKKLYTECEKLYLCSPLDLMKIMMVAAQKSEECDIVRALQYWQSYLLGGTQITTVKQMEVKDISALEVGQSSHVHSEETLKTSKSINKKQESAQCFDINNTPSLNSRADEDLKMAISDDIDAVEWTDDWGDFSDDSIEANNDKKDKFKPKGISQEEIILPLDHTIANCATEEARFKLFQKRFNQINNLEQYQEMKRIMSQWPKFNIPDHITIDNHPVLKMMKLIIALTKTNTAELEKRILQEYEELIGLLTSEEVLQ